MRLDPRGLHNQNGITGGVGLIKRIGCKLKDIVPDLLCGCSFIAVVQSTVHPVVIGGLILAVIPMEHRAGKQLDFLFCHRLTNTRIRFTSAKVGHLNRDLHDLLLVHNGAIGLIKNFSQPVIVKDNGFFAIHAVDIAGNHTCTQGTWAIQGDKSNDLAILFGLHVLNGCRHTRGLNLENTSRMTGAQQFINFRIRKIDLIDINIYTGSAWLERILHRLRHLLNICSRGIRCLNIAQGLIDNRKGT